MIPVWEIFPNNLVPWPSGKARVCKTLTPRFESGWYLQSASVAESADAQDLKESRQNPHKH